MNKKYFTTLLCGVLTHWSARAHEGHGLQGSSHWHATDTLAFIGLGVAIALVWAISKRK